MSPSRRRKPEILPKVMARMALELGPESFAALPPAGANVAAESEVVAAVVCIVLEMVVEEVNEAVEVEEKPVEVDETAFTVCVLSSSRSVALSQLF